VVPGVQVPQMGLRETQAAPLVEGEEAVAAAVCRPRLRWAVAEEATAVTAATDR